MHFIPVIANLNFQSSMSHDPTEIILIWLFAVQELLLLVVVIVVLVIVSTKTVAA